MAFRFWDGHLECFSDLLLSPASTTPDRDHPSRLQGLTNNTLSASRSGSQPFPPESQRGGSRVYFTPPSGRTTFSSWVRIRWSSFLPSPVPRSRSSALLSGPLASIRLSELPLSFLCPSSASSPYLRPAFLRLPAPRRPTRGMPPKRNRFCAGRVSRCGCNRPSVRLIAERYYRTTSSRRSSGEGRRKQ